MNTISRRLVLTGVASVGLLAGMPRAALAATAVLPNGGTLPSGSALMSPNGTYRCVMQGDGNLVVYRSDGAVIWTTNTAGGAGFLANQSDGNLVIYRNSGGHTWATSTNGVSRPWLVMQDDGNLVLYDDTNRAVWASRGGFLGDQLQVNQRLNAGQQMVSRGGQYRLVMQGDGNLVAYTDNRAIWSSNTAGQGPSFLNMQGDGNLVIYRNSGGHTWATSTAGTSNPRLHMQTDGNVVVYASSGRAVWSSGSSPSSSDNSIIARAKSWTDVGVSYNQSLFWSNQYGKYRQDCSGFVSMAWGLTSSYVTSTLPKVSSQIEKSQLQVGDALLNTASHVLIFAGWTDASQTRYWAHEQTPPKAIYHQVKYPYWDGYGTFLPYRKG